MNQLVSDILVSAKLQSIQTFSHKRVRKISIAKLNINNTVDTDSNLIKEKHVSL